MSYAEVVSLQRVGTAQSDTPLSGELAEQAAAQLEIEARYSGYIARQTREIEKQRTHASTSIPRDFDYADIQGLSNEVREKLERIRPETIGQASRISGITPAAISLLLIQLKKRDLRKSA